MKANELMLGNYVQNSNGNIGKVIGYTEYGEVIVRYSQNSTCFSDPDLLLPVPLTSEILEKNGFEKTIHEGLHKNTYQLDRLFIHEHHNKVIFPYFWIDLGVTDIKYVHELQNALNLCDIDKEIVL